jgi:hypothetical protein
MTLIAMSVAIPAGAQVVTAGQVGLFGATPVPNEAQMNPDVVVARLMSFDQNHDGRLTRAELPERMQPLFARADVSRDEAIDGAEVRRLAATPPRQVVVRGFEVGHYGFGDDGGFDSRLHIESAIEDLRLASATRDKVLGIGRTFADQVQARAKRDLLSTAQAVLTPDQLISLKTALDQEMNVNIKTDDPAVAQTIQALVTRQLRQTNVTRVVAQFVLGDEQTRQLQAALEGFNAHRLSEAERSALLDKLHGTLSEEQCDDLRAALERRPIVKQGAQAFAGATVSVQQGHQGPPSAIVIR